MLIGILRMPPCVGAPIDRRMITTVDKTLRSVGAESHNFWLSDRNPYDLVLGSAVKRQPGEMYKLFHLSQDGQYCFETVIELDHTGHRIFCLYTKVISRHVNVMVSLRAIERFSESQDTLLPLADIISDHYWNKVDLCARHDIHTIVPLVVDKAGVDEEVMNIIGSAEEGADNANLKWQCKPIYDYEPGIFEALVAGQYTRSPFKELRVSPPFIQIQEENNLLPRSDQRQKVYWNNSAFDDVVGYLVTMRPSQISVMTTIHHALEGHLDLSVTYEMTEPYRHVLPFGEEELRRTKDSLKIILYKCAMTYCHLTNTQAHHYASERLHMTKLLVEKSLYDEVKITFIKETGSPPLVFYTSFPLIALSTLSVGKYL